MSNLVIVAIPDENDQVWRISSEKIPHLTLLFLGDTDTISNLDQIVLFVEHAVDTSLKRFFLTVDHRGELGSDQADVLFFNTNFWDCRQISRFRATLLQNNNIKTAYDSTSQFDGPWQPHLTLGYPDTPAKPLPDDQTGIYDVSFNKIAVWVDDFDGPEFLLKDQWNEVMDTIPMDVAMSDIQHFGVKGMKWGVRKEAVGSVAKSVGRTAGKAAKATGRLVGDTAFESLTESRVTQRKITGEASRVWAQKDIDRINRKPKYAEARKLKYRLTRPLDPMVRSYRGELKQSYIKRLEETANSMTNTSGTRQYTIRERGGDLPNSKYFWEVNTRRIQHAEVDEETFTVEVVLDDDGFATGLKPVENSMTQTMGLGEEFLEHYGVKGMRWGVRREGAVTTQTHIDTGLLRRRTKVQATGGHSAPAHSDAVKAAMQKQLVKKSGTDALSTQELRDLANRLQVEGQVKVLMSSKGQRFVAKQLEEQGKQGLKKGAKRAVPHVIKKASKGAATVATTAALL